MKDFEIVNAIKDLQKQHHEGAQTLSEAEKKEIAVQLKDYRQQLSDLLSQGANPCPDCGEKPMGMKRAFGIVEVGCFCAPQAIVEGDKVRRLSHSAQGESVDEAVYNWNNQKYIIDDKPLA